MDFIERKIAEARTRKKEIKEEIEAKTRDLRVELAECDQVIKALTTLEIESEAKTTVTSSRTQRKSKSRSSRKRVTSTKRARSTSGSIESLVLEKLDRAKEPLVRKTLLSSVKHPTSMHRALRSLEKKDQIVVTEVEGTELVSRKKEPANIAA